MSSIRKGWPSNRFFSFCQSVSSGSWSKSWNGGSNRRPYDATTARSMSAIACKPGPGRTGYAWITFSRASRNKTLMWFAITVRCPTHGWDSACLRISTRSGVTPPGVAGLTAKNGLDGHGRHHAEAEQRAAAFPRLGSVLKDGELL